MISSAEHKPSLRESVTRELDWLQSKWPELFVAVRPMAIGIWQKIATVAAQDGRDFKALRQAIRNRCNSTKYLAACAMEGAFRHDLDGGPIADDHRAHASGRHTRRLEKYANRARRKKEARKAGVK